MHSQRERVLVIDDDTQFRALVKSCLEEKGLEVAEAGCASSARALLANLAPDLIIVDGMLPDIDGALFVEELRQNGNVKPVFFVSAHWRAAEQYKHLTNNLKVSSIIHKPIVPSLFAEQVARALTQLSTVGSPRIEKNQQLMQRIKVLTENYAEQIPELIDELRGAVQEAKQDTGSGACLERAINLAHRQKGTSGSYGFNALSEQFEKIEHGLKLLSNRKLKQPGSVWSAIDVAIENACKSELRVLESERTKLPDTTTTSRVLLVDEHQEFVELAKSIGQKHLLDVVCVSGQKEAMDVIRGHSLQAAVIAESPQRGDDSLALIAELRDFPTCEKLPIALVSADAGLERRIMATSAGASLFLEQPVEPHAFTAAFEQLLVMRNWQRPHILVVDDDPNFTSYIAELLSAENMIVHQLNDSTLVLEKLAQVKPALLMLDVTMPGISGFDICRVLRTMPMWQDLPIVFVSANTDWEFRVATFKAGGEDYVPKPVIPEELAARVKLRVERRLWFRERTEKDPTTGLLLRRPFLEQFSALLSEAKRHSWPVSLVVLDVDHFKRINDTYGHLMGDAVLATMGRFMTNRFRVEDLRARWGGEEFILAFRAERPSTIATSVELALDNFRKIPFLSDDGQEFHVTFSAGVAAFPEDGLNIQQLVQIADARLYNAKQAGRARVVCE